MPNNRAVGDLRGTDANGTLLARWWMSTPQPAEFAMSEKTSPVSRRSLLKGGSAVAATALFSPAVIRKAWAAETITLLTWETYHDDAWVEEWGKANNTEVKAVRIGSVDE